MYIDGGIREFITVPQDKLLKSEGLSLDELALIEPLAVGAPAVRHVHFQKGKFVLVMEAGSIGMGIMEFAKNAYVTVIAIEVNEHRLQFCTQELHIKHTIDDLHEDVVKELLHITNGDMPTAVFDATGNLKSINTVSII
ncbi:zinc-binding dehydrogenase [Ilyomonas limi]|uniref:Zinc-binding dehydrogenase n=1 Tax=Ilyomonas limi TaxID=2575867 RepID=A0A4U3KU11_9BACT|nr:zinc-binding dehydrogenase [Ilyomonas limi]TKK65822.1 zinc-binding dehydrogenase [Ilyomonas limi]